MSGKLNHGWNKFIVIHLLIKNLNIKTTRKECNNGKASHFRILQHEYLYR